MNIKGWVIGLGLVMGVVVTNGDTALLKKVDDYRTFGKNFSFDMRIMALKNGQRVDEYMVKGYVVVDRYAKTMLYFYDPPMVKDRKMYIEDSTIWMAFPRTQNTIRLSPLQTILGEASAGDVANISFSATYETKSVTKETKDGTATLKLVLEPLPDKRTSAYGRVVLWVSATTHQPLLAQFYTTPAGQQKLVKTVAYVETTPTPFGMIVSKMEISNEVTDDKRRTILEYKNFKRHTLPAALFQKDYLQRFQPEAR